MKLFFTFCAIFFSLTEAYAQVPYKLLSGEKKNEFRLDFTQEPPIQGPLDSVWMSQVGLGESPEYSWFFDSTGNYLFKISSRIIKNSNDSTMISDGFYASPFWATYNLPNKVIMLVEKQFGRIGKQDYLWHVEYNPYANNGKGEVLVDTQVVQIRGGYADGDRPPFVLLPGKTEEDLWLIYSGKHRPNPLAVVVDTFMIYKYDNGTFKPVHIGYISDKRVSYMTVSHNGKMIAITDKGGHIYTYNFDPITGELSEQRFLDAWSNVRIDGSTEGNYPYFCTFSPNDSFLYVAPRPKSKKYEDVPPEITQNFYQYNLFPDEPGKQKTLLAENINYRGILTAANGKIYMINYWGNIDIIEYPDKAGKACRYLPSLAENGNYHGRFFYPVFFPIHNSHFVRFAHKNTCNGVDFYNRSDSLFTSFTWYFQDLQNGTEDSATGSTASFNLAHSGRYYVRLKGQAKSGYIAWYSDTLNLHHPVKPQVSFAPPDTICEHVPVNFFAGAHSPLPDSLLKESWQWSFGDGTTATGNPSEKVYTATGNNTVKLIYSNGFCSDTIQYHLFVNELESSICEDYQPVIWVPNAFRPGSGISLNRVFSIGSTGIRSLEIVIFNRWGNPVFESNDVNFTWDGTSNGVIMPEDKYFYTIHARGIDNSFIRKTGTVTVLR